MKNIIFKVYNESGHLIPTFTLAHRLRSSGVYNVVYIAKEEFRDQIIRQGFVFEKEISIDNISAQLGYGVDSKGILKRYLSKYSRARSNINSIFVSHMASIIKRYQPRLVLVDELCIEYVMMFMSAQVPIITLSTYLLSYEDKKIPPPNASIIPNNTLWSRACIRVKWQLYYSKRFWLQLRLFVMNPARDFYFRCLAQSLKYAYRDRVTSKKFYWIDDFQLPKFVLCPQCFDFPRVVPSNIYFLGPCVDLSRAGRGFTWADFNGLDDQKPIVFCSLGTQTHRDLNVCTDFIRKLIRVFKELSNVNAIVSLGKTVSPGCLGDIPRNVFIREVVPQIQVLKKSRFMITHGGLGTVKECICLGVPMLVYPVNVEVDQVGNAARVKYHNLGVVGNIRNDSIEELKSNILLMLNNDAFYKNVKNMQDKMLMEENSHVFMDYLVRNIHGVESDFIAAGKPMRQR